MWSVSSGALIGSWCEGEDEWDDGEGEREEGEAETAEGEGEGAEEEGEEETVAGGEEWGAALLTGDVSSGCRDALMGNANELTCRMTDSTSCGVGQRGSSSACTPPLPPLSLLSRPLPPPSAVAGDPPATADGAAAAPVLLCPTAAAIPAVPLNAPSLVTCSDSTNLTVFTPFTSAYSDAWHSFASEPTFPTPLSPAISASRAAAPMFPAIALPTCMSKKRSAACWADPSSSDCMVRCSGCSALRGKSALA